jgi:hypothetical protein
VANGGEARVFRDHRKTEKIPSPEKVIKQTGWQG